VQRTAQRHKLARALIYRGGDASIDIHDGHSIEA